VLGLSAKTHPPVVRATGSAEEPKEITLIARTNLEGELRKLFFSETDSAHLDVAPRMELIDAVDADGDGRGECCSGAPSTAAPCMRSTASLPTVCGRCLSRRRKESGVRCQVLGLRLRVIWFS